MFSTVQYIPESQRVYLRERLAEMLETCGCSEDTARTEMFSEKLADHIDSALAAPLEQKLGMFVANLASRKSGRVYSYTPAKVDYFCRTLERSLEKRFGKYLDNDDTDDAFREIRLNRQQVRNLTEGAVVRMRHEMTQYAKSGPLHQVFNAASWPISLQALRVKASSAADEIIQATTFFMDRQVVTGDTLKLSGGEKQKLMMAVARLHKPDILFLDEITAALDRETGKRQYQELMDSLPKQTIVVSIAHNLHIMPSHNLHVHLKDQGVTVRRVDPAGLNPGPKPGV